VKDLDESAPHSGVPVNKNPWPYNPHCTLRAGEPLRAAAAALLARAFPQGEFLINTVSVYQLDAKMQDCQRLCKESLEPDGALAGHRVES
jgi:hypothetical protein